MFELEVILEELGISQYLEVFVEHGFDTWAAIQDVTESDLDALGVKLGHRRKLQRRIAESRGFSPDRALASPPRNTATDDRQADEQHANITRAEGKDAATGSGPQGSKRKYRRHPKPDANAPERPASAYVLFSNTMREELKGQNLSFTEIAKLVGENWQNLPPAEKEPYEQRASVAKEKYNADLVEYKKTGLYVAYARYLVEFKVRQSNQQQVTDLDAPKRPKLVNSLSNESTGSTTSSNSQYDQDTPTARTPGDSPPPGTTQWPPLESHLATAHPSADSPPPSTSHWPPVESHPPTALALPAVQPGPRRDSPGSPPNVHSGYRGAIYVGNTQALPWREANREKRVMPLQQRRRVASIGDRPSGYPGPQGDPLNIAEAMQIARRMALVPHPPSASASLSSYSTLSSHSTNSSSYLSPRTPLEPTLERGLSMHSLFPQPSPGNYENQLPPLRTSPLTPQPRDHGSLHSSSNKRPMGEFPSSMAPMRGHPNSGSPHSSSAGNHDPRPRKFGSAEDDNLDPVSALLRAGEIVGQNNRGPPPS